jgi:hypothetical protein
MVTKKNTEATETATVVFDVVRGSSGEEVYRTRTWNAKGTTWLVIDPYGSVQKRPVLEGTLSDLLIDTNVRRIDPKAGRIIQLHAFSVQPPRINNDLLKASGGPFEELQSYLTKTIKEVDHIVMATGALSRRYAVGEERVSRILAEIEKMGKTDVVRWIVNPSNGLPSSPTHRSVRREGDWLLEKAVNYHPIA